MKKSRSVILGIPVDAFTTEGAIAYLFHLMDSYALDRRPKLVCTANTDFIVNTMSWRLERSRHPELLAILREADLVTADGMPVVWASRYLGPALTERVTGADLVPSLADEAARRGASLYFLGGAPGSADRAAAVLRERFPDLRIVGCDSPSVCIEGPKLADACEDDEAIVERINGAAPDLLLVAFGNPKQELFFERNRHRLKVPVTIGIGGTFDFIAGTTPRAPGWMRDKGLEWLYRLAKEPGRLWKRYLVDFVKLGLQIWPSIMLYQYTKGFAPHYYLKRCKSKVSYKYLTRYGEPVIAMTLPGIVDAETVPRLEALIPKRPAAHLVLDVGDVQYIDSAGLGLLLSVTKLWDAAGYGIALGGAGAYANKVLAANRLQDLFAGRIFPTLDQALERVNACQGAPGFSMEVREEEGGSSILLSGSLRTTGIPPAEIRAKASLVKGDRCTVDLSGLASINTAGIVFLLRLKKILKELGRECRFTGATGDVRQMLKITKTFRLL